MTRKVTSNRRGFRPAQAQKRVGAYRSKFEAGIASQLTDQGVSFTYEKDQLCYTVTHRYSPDFVLANGIVIEAKGYFTGADRAKMLAVKAQNPEKDIRIVFMNANRRLNKTSKTTYGAWATKHGFKWAVGVVPKEWINES